LIFGTGSLFAATVPHPSKNRYNIAFGKTHDLASLLDLLLPNLPDWANLRPTLDALTVYAVEFRYPGMVATQEIAQDALQDCISIRQILRVHLGLS
jgi:DNA-binding transcriptional regulator YdaS (Cro superfamily)